MTTTLSNILMTFHSTWKLPLYVTVDSVVKMVMVTGEITVTVSMWGERGDTKISSIGIFEVLIRRSERWPPMGTANLRRSKHLKPSCLLRRRPSS